MTAALLDTKVNGNDLKALSKDKKADNNEKDKDFFEQIIESLEGEAEKSTSKNSLLEKLFDIPAGSIDTLKQDEDLQKLISDFSKIKIDQNMDDVDDKEKSDVENIKVENNQYDLLEDLYKLSYFMKNENINNDFKNNKTSSDSLKILSDNNISNNLKNVNNIKELFDFAEKNDIKIKNFEFFKEDTSQKINNSSFNKDVKSEDVFKMIEKKFSNITNTTLSNIQNNSKPEDTLKNILSNIEIKDNKVANNTTINSKNEITNIIVPSKSNLSEKNPTKEQIKIIDEDKSTFKDNNTIDMKTEKNSVKSQSIKVDSSSKDNRVQNENNIIIDTKIKKNSNKSQSIKIDSNSKDNKIQNEIKEEKINITENRKSEDTFNEQKKSTLTVKNIQQISAQELKSNFNVKEIKNKDTKNLKNNQSQNNSHIQVQNDEKDFISTVNEEQFKDTKDTKLSQDKSITIKTAQTLKHTQELNTFDSKSDINKKFESLLKSNSDDSDGKINELDNLKNEHTNNLHNIKVDHTKQKSQDVKHTLNTFAQDFKEQVESYKPPLMKVKMQLNPKGLGEVDVTMINRGNNLHVTVNSNPNTIAIFTQNQVEFKNSLVNMGFSELNMSFNENGQNKNNDQNQKNKNNSNKDFEEEQLQDSFEITTPIYI